MPWIRDDGAGREFEDATGPARRAARSSGTGAREALTKLGRRVTLPTEVATEIRNAADVATPRQKERLVEQAEQAYAAYERGRYTDALRLVKPVAAEAPGVAAVRELAGLSAYRSARWREAARHLEALGTLEDSSEHLPVLMDCQRALRKPRRVADLWAELRHRSPDPDVLAEGRIVAASSLADSGDLQGAIVMLANSGASRSLRNPSERHVRQWYVLGDLYERAGDVPRARQYFERVGKAEPEAYDVSARLAALGSRGTARRASQIRRSRSRSTRSPGSP